MSSRKERFAALELPIGAGPSQIKKAYRRLAFELHPDLHPNSPDAVRKFQELNEAYVMLMKEYEHTSYSAANKKTTTQTSSGPDTSDERTKAEARKAYEKAKSRFDTAGSSSASSASQKSRASQYSKPSKEDLLKDLLNDPFARRVFEDIYSHVNYSKAGEKDVPNKVKPSKSSSKLRKVYARPAKKPLIIAAAHRVAGLAKTVKGWLRKQIDEEQVLYLPGESLRPGAKIRLKVRTGLSEESKTIEFALPPEFAIGKPIRLKGMGKKLGSLRGDLFLRVYNNDEMSTN